MELYARLQDVGGVGKRANVARSARLRRELASALAEGMVLDLGAGWLATADTQAALVKARRFNATVTCVSAAGFYGLQVLREPAHVHLAVPRSRGCRPRPSRPTTGVYLHRESAWTRPVDPRVPLAPIAEVLTRVLRCQPEEHAIVVVDSALNKNMIRKEELVRALVGPGSAHARVALDRCDRRSRSAIETRARLILRADGLDVRAGVVIAGVGEVDLLVEGRVVLECDGYAFHSSRRQFGEDRRRDRALVAAGYLVLRFTAEEIMNRPELVVEEVRRALARL
ncbi:endonuclease domain-containing protein [Georgenia sp. SYP-B2076]|uniref:endonuclease domain-containing protein n=1 Tax=Georgenia sp. SYP-B2076 TaxID=2495881 RepID=UPI0013E0808B|nr:DUF559 domain-containing protein [Georgenia sp. SYP-B2076]